jgi:hypothetical protein
MHAAFFKLRRSYHDENKLCHNYKVSIFELSERYDVAQLFAHWL